jgi:preprotein translocase subunit SecG
MRRGSETAPSKDLGKAMQYLFAILLFVTAIFLILLVLVQRGRGGGLAGAFGGMGGQSAFGTKAGDLFTRITMVVATFWILLCILSIAMLNSTKDSAFGSGASDSMFGGSGLEDAGGDDEASGDQEASSGLPGVGGGADAGDAAPVDDGSSGGPPSDASGGGASGESD